MKKLNLICGFGLFTILILGSCKKQSTSWQSDWASPLVNDTLSLANYYNDSTLTVNSNGTIDVDLSRTILDIGIADLVKVPDTVISQIFHPTVGGLTIPPGFSMFNAIEEHDLDLPGIELKKIRVLSGRIFLRVYNPLPTAATYKVILPGVIKDNQVFEMNFTVPAGTNSNPGMTADILDLNGYVMDLRGVNMTHFNTLQSQLEVKNDINGIPVTLSTSDEFKVEAEMRDLKIDYAQGYFGNQIVSDTSSFNLPYLNNIISGALDLPSMALHVQIENGMKVPLKGIISTVSNSNVAGQTVSLNAPTIGQNIFISPATGTWNAIQNSQATLDFTSANSNVEQIIENLGSSFNLGYSIQLNPYGNTNGGWDEVFSNSRIKVKLLAQLPLQLMSDGLTLQDTFDINFKQDNGKTRISSGKLILEALNAFQMQCEAKLSFLKKDVFTLYEVLGSSLIQSSLYGAIDPQDNLMKKTSTLEFVLPEALIADLEKIKKLKVEVKLDTPDPNNNGTNFSISIPAGAYVGVKVKTRFKTTIVY